MSEVEQIGRPSQSPSIPKYSYSGGRGNGQVARAKVWLIRGCNIGGSRISGWSAPPLSPERINPGLTLFAIAYRAADGFVDHYLKNQEHSYETQRIHYAVGEMPRRVIIYTLAREPVWLNAQEGTIKVPLRFFTADEARMVAAACARIFPSDESGPGAKEAGVIIYIDHQLAGPYGRDKYRYTKGPWVESVPSMAIREKRTRRRFIAKG